MKTVLVVDDEFDLLHSICAILKSEGYEVIGAPNGRAALDLIKKKRPDLVITDLMMPYLSGRDLLKAVHDLPGCEQLPSILMSGASAALEHGEGRWSAALQKPFSLEALLETVDRLIGKAEAPRAQVR